MKVRFLVFLKILGTLALAPLALGAQANSSSSDCIIQNLSEQEQVLDHDPQEYAREQALEAHYHANDLRDPHYSREYFERYYYSDWMTRNEYGEETSTVVVTPSRYTINGLRLRIIKRIGHLWESSHRSVTNALEADPRNFIRALGAKAASKFGFKMLSSKEMTAPSAAILNRTIEEINTKLATSQESREAFSLRFDTPVNDNVTDREYVEAFAQLRLPLARRGALFVHDISAHSLSFLIPERFLRLAQRQAEFMLDFERFLAAHHPELAKTKQYQDFLDRLYKKESLCIDFGTGNFGLALGREDISNATEGIKTLANDGVTPGTALSKNVSALIKYDPMPEEMKRTFLKALDEFKQSHELFDSPAEDVNSARLDQEIKKRISIVQEALAD